MKNCCTKEVKVRIIFRATDKRDIDFSTKTYVVTLLRTVSVRRSDDGSQHMLLWKNRFQFKLLLNYLFYPFLFGSTAILHLINAQSLQIYALYLFCEETKLAELY